MFSYSNRINTVSIDFCRLYQIRLREMRKGDNYVQDDGRYAKKVDSEARKSMAQDISHDEKLSLEEITKYFKPFKKETQKISITEGLL